MTLESKPALLMQHHLLSKTKVTCPLLSTCSADREWSHITSNTIPKMTPVQHRHHRGTFRVSPLQLCNQRSVFNEILLTWINVVLILREGCSRHKMWYWFLRCSLVLSSWPFQKMQSISSEVFHQNVQSNCVSLQKRQGGLAWTQAYSTFGSALTYPPTLQPLLQKEICLLWMLFHILQNLHGHFRYSMATYLALSASK